MLLFCCLPAKKKKKDACSHLNIATVDCKNFNGLLFYVHVVKTLHVPQKIHVRLRGLGVKTSAKTAFKT